MSNNLDKYNASIKNRSFLKFVIGLVPRVFIYMKFAYIRWVARRMGGGNWRRCYDAIIARSKSECEFRNWRPFNHRYESVRFTL